MFQTVEQQRMVGDNEIAAALPGFGHDLFGDINTCQNTRAFPGAVGEHLPARVVPFLLKGERGELFYGCGYVVEGRGHSLSSGRRSM